MNLTKAYEFTVRLGIETTTLDAEGDVVKEAPCPPIEDDALREAAAGFVGPYELAPPAFSALKRNGRRLYELARAGETPVVETRAVTIHDMEMLGAELPDVRLSIRCSRGTYVRSLAKDFGARFDLPAHILRLVRTAIGPFKIEDALDGQVLFDGSAEGFHGLALADALEFMPGIVLSDASRRGLLGGVLPDANDVVKTIGAVSGSAALRILDQEGVLLAIGRRPKVGGHLWVESYRLFVDQRSVSRG